jgi:hypothetical protein
MQGLDTVVQLVGFCRVKSVLSCNKIRYSRNCDAGINFTVGKAAKSMDHLEVDTNLQR